jgi:hypothetical protein
MNLHKIKYRMGVVLCASSLIIPTISAAQDVREILSGKTLTSQNTVLSLQADGNLQGEILGDNRQELRGTWRIVTLMCADLSEAPIQMLGEPYCNVVTEISDTSVSLDYTRPDGRRPTEFTITD